MAIISAFVTGFGEVTVEEAAGILRISRNAAYAHAREWRASGGRSGLPCFEVGRCIRVLRTALDQMIGSALQAEAT